MCNPFTPSFGQVPRHLAGRRILVSDISRAFESGLGHPALASLLVGARGTGKTALLSYLASEAESLGWVAVHTVCVEGMLDDIYQQTLLAAEHLVEPRGGRKLTGLSVGGALNLEWENVENFQPNWRTRMSRVLDQLAEHDAGLVITVDEVDPSLDEMIHLASVYQLFVRERRQVSLIMAGLPSHVLGLIDHKSVSFLRRASRYTLDRVEDYEVASAFRKTVEEAGKTIDDDALDIAVKAADGFPYMIQLVGFRAWEESESKGETRLSPASAEAGARVAAFDFEARVLRATLDELSEGDIRFLNAMADDEGETAVSDIEQRLGRSSGYVARYRKRLIEAGVIGPRGRGKLAFELPGLRDYLREREPGLSAQ